jgi:hypothetical protein
MERTRERHENENENENEIEEIVSQYIRAADWHDGEALAKLYEGGEAVVEIHYGAGVAGVQGRIAPIESGYYRPRLRRFEGEWRIANHAIALDQPMAHPGGVR